MFLPYLLSLRNWDRKRLKSWNFQNIIQEGQKTADNLGFLLTLVTLKTCHFDPLMFFWSFESSSTFGSENTTKALWLKSRPDSVWYLCVKVSKDNDTHTALCSIETAAFFKVRNFQNMSPIFSFSWVDPGEAGPEWQLTIYWISES